MEDFEMLVRVKVFGDDENCSHCDYIKQDNYNCGLFLVPIADYLKCDQCKAHYNQQKQANDRNRITSEALKPYLAVK